MAAVRHTFGALNPWQAKRAPDKTRTGGLVGRQVQSISTARRTSNLAPSDDAHPFDDATISSEIDRRENEVESAFGRIAKVLQELAPLQFSDGFPDHAVSRLNDIGVSSERCWFDAGWANPLDLGEVHARCVSRLFSRHVETGTEQIRYRNSDEGEPMNTLIERWGFHAVDIVACADGRLSGLLGAVLRVPFSIVSKRSSYAGAMFPVADALDDWGQIELHRWHTAAPDQPNPISQYLKIGVYHFSSVDPANEGCAAHSSNDCKAVSELLGRLIEFKGAVRAKHGIEDGVALLLVGVDTDTDAIRVHVPDVNGRVYNDKYVDACDLHAATAQMSKKNAKDAVRAAVASCAGVAAEDALTEGMRWFCGYLLKNNIAQVSAVLRKYGGPYPVAGHAEKLILIGDAIDDVQLRNLAFQAQMASVEEGADDLAVGFKILGPRCAQDSVAVPVLVVRDYDADIPGDKRAAVQVASRMRNAAKVHAPGPVAIEAAVRPAKGGPLEFLACGCAQSDKLRAVQ